jgi:hypothetical protein
VIGGARFLAEIRTTANLQHPHILPLHDSGEVDGTVFYVMPFVDGESLRDSLAREKQLPIDDALRIAREVADALHYAHGHGVIHRDIKPENILLHGGHALVADFGIALAASSTAGTRMTETGMSLGTPHYMSPEQAMGERDITPRADVYALGCVAYEMLLGEPPFTGPTAQSIVAKVLSERPAPLRTRRDRIPEAVEAAVLTALEKLPADRFGTVAEFATALSAPPTTTTSAFHSGALRGRREDRRLPFAAGLVTGLALAGSVALCRGTPTATSAMAGTQLTFDGRSFSPGISPDGEFVAFVKQQCAIASDVACSQSLIVQAVTNARPVEVLRDVRQLRAPRWTADGQSLVVVARLDSLRYGLVVVPRLGGVPRTVGPAGYFDTHAKADSLVVVERVGTDGEQMARFIVVASGVVADSVSLGRRAVDGIAWSPDGRMLAVVQDYTSITIVRRDGTPVDSLLGPFRNTVRWTPDGRGVLLFRGLPVKEDDLDRISVDANGRLGERTVVLAKFPTILRGEFDVARRTGQLALLTGVANWDLWTFDLGAPASARQRTTGTTWYGGAAISPDGTRLYYLRGDAIGDNLYSLTLPDSEEALRADRRPGGFYEVNVSNDHRRVIFGAFDTTGILLGDFDVASRQARMTPWGTSSGGRTPQPFGTRGLVYLPAERRSLVVLDSIGGSPRAVQAPDSIVGIGGDFALSSDGKSAAVVAHTAHSILLGVTPLDRWDLRVLHRLEPGLAGNGVSWANDGWIYVATTRGVGEAAVLWRLREDQPRLTQVMTLPQGCTAASVSISAAAARGTCVRSDTRGDVWIAELPGMRK